MNSTVATSDFTSGTHRRDAGSMLIPVTDDAQIHVRRYGDSHRNTTIVLLHDLFSDGGLFLRDGNALGSQLAQAGFEVWVPDLRGHGRSWPLLGRDTAKTFTYDFHSAVTGDLAAVIGLLRDQAPDKPLYLVGHGVGGLLWLSFLARWPMVREMVRGVVLLGAATHREHGGLGWRLRDDLFTRWRALQHVGMVLRRGSDGQEHPETRAFYQDVHRLLDRAWVDPVDGLDHAAQLQQLPHWPPTLTVCADLDAPWSGRVSARLMQEQLPPHDGRLYRFSKSTGVRLRGPHSALAGGAGADDLRSLIMDWLVHFDID